MRQNRSFPVIGITGGAGSGKSTVVESIKRLVPTEFLHCDAIAHELMEPDGASYEALLGAFGEGILEDEGTLQNSQDADVNHSPKRRIARERLSKIAMATPESRSRLNALTHPLVRKEVERRLAALKEADFDGVAVIEAALLLEAGFSDLCDEIWYVHAPTADRIRRMKENRGYTDEKIHRILEGQLSEEVFQKRTDFAVRNPDTEDGVLSVEMECQIKERLERMRDL